MQQNTTEWYEVRAGKITSSQFHLFTGTRLGDAARTYARKIVGERLATAPEAQANTKNFADGHAREPLAIKAYEQKTWRKVTACGFILAPGYEDVGGSPDGLVEDLAEPEEMREGIIEVKNKLVFEKHVEILISQSIPDDHKPQIQGNLLATGRAWCDFISYCPEMNEHALVILRQYRDEAYISKLKYQLEQFRALVAKTASQVKKP